MKADSSVASVELQSASYDGLVHSYGATTAKFLL